MVQLIKDIINGYRGEPEQAAHEILAALAPEDVLRHHYQTESTVEAGVKFLREYTISREAIFTELKKAGISFRTYKKIVQRWASEQQVEAFKLWGAERESWIYSADSVRERIQAEQVVSTRKGPRRGRFHGVTGRPTKIQQARSELATEPPEVA